MCKDAPSPDPAIGAAAAAQAAIAKESLDFYKSVYESDIKPMQLKDQALREGLIGDMRSSMKQQQQFADDQNAYYKSTFQPVEKKMVEEAMGYDSDANIAQRRGIASASVNNAFSNARDQQSRSLSAYGVNPNSGAFARANASLTSNQALANASSQNQADFETRDKAVALRAGAANFGRNMPNTAATYYSNANSAGSQAGGISAQGMASVNQNAATMGSGFNTAIQGNQSAGNLYLGKFGAEMQGYQADQAAVGGLFSAAGMAFGGTKGFGMFKADGGKVVGPGGPRDDKVPAMLSHGEFVLNEGAVKKYGLSKLEKMNKEGLKNQQARGLRS
jgi:hypothetical protein